MIYSVADRTPITLPLTLAMHQVAERFYQNHLPGDRARQVYLNTLAVLAVNSYLGTIDIATDLERADSWQVPIQILSDVADLPIRDRGAIECRPVLATATACHVPPETWWDRLGFVAVSLDVSLQSATLLGFLPSVQAEWVSLNDWQPLEQLLLCLRPRPTPLLDWLEDRVTAGWLTIEQLCLPHSPAWQFRSTPSIGLSTTTARVLLACRGKSLNLYSLEGPIALLVGLDKTDQPDIDVWVKVCPLGDTGHLPAALELQVLDQEGLAVMQAQARETASIQVNFSGKVGETFSIRIMLGSGSALETFVL